LTIATVPSVPTDPCPIARQPGGDPGADGINRPGNFVTRHARVGEIRPMALFDKGIAVTDAASRNLQTNGARAGLRNWPFGDDKFASGSRDLNYLHLRT